MHLYITSGLDTMQVSLESIINDDRWVYNVRLVVHTAGPAGPSMNHWSIYLLLVNGGSVRLNMAAYPHPDYTDGVVEWTMHSYVMPRSAITY